MPRINDIPDIEVFVVDNDEAWRVGNPVCRLAPALCNAIFDLTGKHS
jgi:CO/xanthine dehydrogenase Mo-binding subunit